MVDFATARRNMVESQVRPNEVTDPRLIEAMLETPREIFVPESFKSVAYGDKDVDLGGGRCMMAPMLLARLLQTAEVGPRDIVLDVGCASGYSAAVLARLCDTVVAVEEDRDLAARASTLLAELGVDNAAVIEGPLADGCAKQAPYDVILFGGAVSAVPEAIAAQLAEGGRMVAVVDDGAGMGTATLTTRRGDTLSSRPVFDASTPILPGFATGPEFVF